jgi:hypothetical protein
MELTSWPLSAHESIKESYIICIASAPAQLAQTLKKGGGCIGSNVDLGIGRIPHLSLHPSDYLDAGLC